MSKYPIGGYAPGNYRCICVDCKQHFSGDKRAVQCEPCATKIQQSATHPLLTPRFEVIADYPHSPYRVGDIIQMGHGDTAMMTLTPIGYDHFEGKGMCQQNSFPVEEFKKYPRIYRQLEWWQRRTPEDMPQYLKARMVYLVVKNPKYCKKLGAPSEWAFISDAQIHLKNYLPATLEEYTSYINSKKTDK